MTKANKGGVSSFLQKEKGRYATKEILVEIPAAPPSTNALWRKNPRGGMFLSSKAVDFYGDVRFAVGGLRAPDQWEFYDVQIIVYPKRRTGDIDNFIKPVLDSLTKAGFWPDDDRVARVSCEFGNIEKEGKTLVKITPLATKYKG